MDKIEEQSSTQIDENPEELKPAKKRFKKRNPKKRTDVIQRIDKPYTMYCAGFAPETTHGDLERFFGAENIDRQGYIRFKQNSNNKPFAFITFKNKKVAMDIKQTLATRTLAGNYLDLKNRYFKN